MESILIPSIFIGFNPTSRERDTCERYSKKNETVVDTAKTSRCTTVFCVVPISASLPQVKGWNSFDIPTFFLKAFFDRNLAFLF